jgi:Domain of unknown function (DUF1840)
VTFESKVGRVTMFGDVAVQMIRMMGRSGTVPSALLAADIPGALAELRQAIDEATPPADAAAETQDDGEEDADAKGRVSLRQRAFPLIKLLEDAARANSDVLWEQQGSGPLSF